MKYRLHDSWRGVRAGRLPTVLMALASWAALAALTPLAAAAGDAVLPPDQDPFYAVPAGIAGLANGATIRSRPVTVTLQSAPLPARAWQVQFKTQDTTGTASAFLTTVMVPTAPWTGRGPRPVLSYQTAEDGVGLKCAPSYMLRGGILAEGNTSSEAGMIASALRRGWIVVAPDYEGPRSMWLGAAGAARGVIDGLRAAFAFKPAGIDPAAPIGVWGYSGGAVASSEAAQMQPAYAPEMRFAGVALGGNNANVKTAAAHFDGSYAGGAIVIGLIGLDRAYPQYHLTRFLNAAGRSAFAASQHDCIADAAVKHPLARAGSFLNDPSVLDGPQFSAVFTQASPLTFPGTPAAPVYDYHATGDELAPIGPDRQLLARYCAAGTRVEAVEDRGGEHILEAGTGAQGAIDYLANRFAGLPVPDTCGGRPGRSPICSTRATGPRARVLPGTVRASRRGVSMRGTARTGCDHRLAAVVPRVSRVSVAIARVVRRRCEFLDARGRLSRPRSCRHPTALRASGTTRWSFKLRTRLPAGRYLVFAWAADTVGRRSPRVGIERRFR